MSKRDSELLIRDILESAQKIINYTHGLSFEQFIDQSMVLDAVIRNFEIIGEASNRLPEEVKDKYPKINWIKIRGFRNRLVHDYMGLDYRIVWSTKEELLPDLINTFENR